MSWTISMIAMLLDVLDAMERTIGRRRKSAPPTALEILKAEASHAHTKDDD
jgi:hypothetical protein